MDRTDRLLDELEVMINSEDVRDKESGLRMKEIITNIRIGKLNIIDLRKSSSRLKYGNDVIDLFIRANDNLAA